MSESQFLENIRENQGIIFKLVGLYANDDEHKKDLSQEIVLQAWKGWSNFRQDAKFSTWLYRICLNTILTQQRKKPIVSYRESLENIAPTVDNLGSQEADAERVRVAVKQLSEVDRAIISMNLDGFDNGEIAVMLGISINNVGVKLHRIKQQLAKLLKN